MRTKLRINGVDIPVVCGVVLICFIMLTGFVLADEEGDLYLQGSLYCQQLQYDKAIDVFQKLVGKYPSTRFLDSYFWIGYCQQQSGNYQQAIQTYRMFASRYPQSGYAAEALYKIGEIYEKNLNDYDKAIVAYSEVGKSFPRSQVEVKSLVRTANIQELVKKDFLGAKQSYQRVNELVSDNKNVYSGYKEKSRERIAFIQENSDNGYQPLKLYTQSLAFEEQGNIEKALEGYNSILKKYPKSALVDDASFRIIKCWEKKGVIPKVKEEGRNFIKSYPGSEYAPQVQTIIQKYGQ